MVSIDVKDHYLAFIGWVTEASFKKFARPRTFHDYPMFYSSQTGGELISLPTRKLKTRDQNRYRLKAIYKDFQNRILLRKNMELKRGKEMESRRLKKRIDESLRTLQKVTQAVRGHGGESHTGRSPICPMIPVQALVSQIS